MNILNSTSYILPINVSLLVFFSVLFAECKHMHTEKKNLNKVHIIFKIKPASNALKVIVTMVILVKSCCKLFIVENLQSLKFLLHNQATQA